MPGVLGVWTGADLNAAGYGALKTVMMVPNRDGSPMKTPTRYSLATDKVRFVGDPVAFVVAETQAQARDAAEAVVLDIEPLPAVTNAREAAQPGAPIVFDDVPGNVCADFQYGDSAKVDEAFAKAAHVTALHLDQQPHRRLRDGAAHRRSATTTRRPTATRSMPATRARSASRTRWPRCSASSRRRCASSPAMSAARSA